MVDPTVGIEVEVYYYNNPTVKVDVLNGRMNPAFMEELRGGGGGNVELSIYDPKVKANPELLAYRNTLKVRVRGKIVGGMVVGKKVVRTIEQGEAVRQVHIVSGEGARVWFEDAHVEPFGGLRSSSYEDRAFNFASETGPWYNPAQWTTPVNVRNWGDVVGSPWRYAPQEWPDAPLAKWVWSQNSVPSAPAGDNYFRYTFTVTAEAKYSFFVAADGSYDIYIDGQLNTQSQPDTIAWVEMARVDVDLLPGEHIFAVKVTNKSGPAGLIAAIFEYGDPDEPSSAVLKSYTGKAGDSAWKVAGYPSPPPGWTVGEIVLQLLNEAEARGVLFPTWLTPTFTGTVDSYGNNWPRDLDWVFSIGTPMSAVIAKLEELACDLWIDLETMELNMVLERGVDRSVKGFDVDGITVIRPQLVFEEGKNLVRARSDGVSQVKNRLVLRTNDGWHSVSASDPSSEVKYGRLEGSMEVNASKTVSNRIAQEVFRQKMMPEEGASYEIIPVPGYVPFEDFNIGDWVLAPNERGILVKRRIMSLGVEEDEAGNPTYSVEFDTIFRDAEDKLNRLLEKMGGSLGSQFSSGSATSAPIGTPTVTAPNKPLIKLPVPPTNLAATSVGLWEVNGSTAFSEVTITWDPVTSNTDGSQTVPELYEVWGKETSGDVFNRLAVAYTESATIRSFETGSAWVFQVRAQNSGNAVGGFSTTITHTMEAPSTPMAAPTAPVLSSDKGVLVVGWDGLLVGTPDAPPPSWFRYVYAEVATSAGGVYERRGATMARNGRQLAIPGLTVGSTYWVRLTAVDGLGIESPASAVASHTLTGVDLGSLDQDVSDAITGAQAAADQAVIDAAAAASAATAAENAATAAQTAANGKNTIHYATTAPAGTEHVVDDVWFDTDDGNKIYRWNGTAWVEAQFGTNAIANLAITDGLIANLDAGKITTGFLDANRIDAQTITADKLILGDGSNMAQIAGQGGIVEYAGVDMDILDTGWFRRTTSTTSTYFMFRNFAGLIPFKLGDFVRVEFEAYVLTADITVDLALWVGSTATEQILSPNIEIRTDPAAFVVEAEITLDPTGALVYSFGLSGLPLNGATVFVRNVRAFIMNAGELIVDGTITGNKIQAESITGNEISAETITGYNLAANAVVAGTIDANAITARELAVDAVEANTIAAGAIEARHLSAGVGGEIDITANASINLLVGQVDGLGTELGTVEGELSDMQTYYQFGVDGAIISQPGNPFSVALRNDRIEMLEGGEAVSYWESGRFFVSSLVGDRVVLGNHQIATFGTGTVVRVLEVIP